MQNETPFIPASEKLPEITFKVILLSIILAFLLAISNTYLALKIGILTSASIPAAIISMSVLRLFRHSNILQNNLVQTAASAGEAIAGGIAYTIPALIIIQYWNHFPYWENFMIALLGGLLGVLFSVPLRRVLMNAPHLHFPEGRAIAVVLQADQHKSQGLKQLLLGGAIGGFLELAQTGFKWIANSFQFWFMHNTTVYGFGGGLSATLLGAGYIIGFRVGLSILLGALINWGIVLPTLSHITAAPFQDAALAINTVYSEKIRYIGIGAILLAGIWTFVTLAKPFYSSLQISIQTLITRNNKFNTLPRTEQDIPIHLVLIGTIFLLTVSYFFLRDFLPTTIISFPYLKLPIELGCIIYIAVVGFIFALLCGYFSGLVGVAASPGSAIVISGMLLAAVILRLILHIYTSTPTHTQLLNGAAMTIIVGSIVAGIAAIANDNIQDLKVGYILGATPWKQQIMLALGAVIAAAIIPLVMQLLFQVYGIANVMPAPHMDPSQTLAAPPAAAMAAITQGIFNHALPWNMLGLGAIIIILLIVINYFLSQLKFDLSLIGIAIGMYLPLSSSIPLFLGSAMALLSYKASQKKFSDTILQNKNLQKNILAACGLVAGAALMDVILAIPMAMSDNPNVLNLAPAYWQPFAILFGVLSIFLLGFWFYRTAITHQQ